LTVGLREEELQTNIQQMALKYLLKAGGRPVKRNRTKNEMTKLTPTEKRALQVLSGIKEPWKGMKAKAFAEAFYEGTEHEYLLTAVSNQGNGACAGKKAWLCAGSFLSKLCKKGLVNQYYDKNRGLVYAISHEGEEALKQSSAER
jgi:predicted transcriptional regulator